jgi:drug/metabolite transporter (DMT)-like permease
MMLSAMGVSASGSVAAGFMPFAVLLPANLSRVARLDLVRACPHGWQLHRGDAMPRKDRIDALGAAALVGMALLFAINQVSIKLLNTGFQPVFLAGLRSCLALVCIYAWMRFRGHPLHFSARTAPAGLLMGLFFAAEFLFLFLALDLTTVVRTSILFYSMPVWMALMAHVGLPGERITAQKGVGLALAFAGTAWAILDRGGAAGKASLLGDLCALGGALGWAGTAYMARGSAMVRERPEMQLFWMVLVSGPVLLSLAPAFGPLIRDLQPLHFAGLFFQVVIVVTAGFIAWLWLLSIYPASGVASFSFLTPVFGLTLGWLLLDEPIGPGILGAAALVCVGIVLINRRPAALRASA